MKWARILKYGIAARILDPLVRHTAWFDGGGLPPEAINFAGGGDFEGIGRRQVDLIHDRAGLEPHHRVLDVGCGIGRIALALSERVPELEYDGFDIVRYGISWCEKRFGSFPGYRFRHADIRNTFYNPFGAIAPETFRFPYPDAAFDRVIATSVFTHLLSGTCRRYLSEAGRVLKPAGRLYLTAFILSEVRSEEGSAFSFRHALGESRIDSLEEPELAVAYPLASMDAWADEAGLSRVSHHPGSWSGATGDDFQDALVYVKRPVLR